MGLPWLMNGNGKHPASSLRIWIPLVFALFVVIGTVGLLLVFERRQRAEELEAFANLAKVNAGFMERTRLPRTEQMATRLSEVIGADVFFRVPMQQRIVGPEGKSWPASGLEWRADGEVEVLADGRMMIAFRDTAGVETVFVRQSQFPGLMDLGSDAWLAMGLFWLLSIGLGFGLSRWISAPLQDLVKALPKVGTDEDLPSLPVNRRDEIGSLARVLKDTHQSLGEERERRRQAERLALLGRMATGIAHEIRNPAAAIRLHAELLDPSDTASLSTSRDLILESAKRLENLVSQWMHFSRPEPPKTSDMDLVAMLREVIEVMTPQARHMNVRLEMPQAEVGAIVVNADRHRLHQVFSNLTLNAIQAMPKGGTVTIELKDKPEEVEIKVRDEGAGFSESALERASEPFFSEKEGGLGLGLAVATDICKAHGGSLELGNLEGRGACIRVVLKKAVMQNAHLP